MKLKIFLSVGFLVLTASVIILVIFWINFPYEPLAILCNSYDEKGQQIFTSVGENERKKCDDLKNSFAVSPETVVSGQTITTLIHYCKNSDGEEVVTRDLVGETIIINVPPKELAVKTPRGCGSSEGIVRIPRTINPGKYYLQYTVSYQVNPLRKETIVFSSEPFTILAAPEVLKK